MIPQDLKENFTKLEAEVSAEKGDFALFALFLREDVTDRWDLMISAPWASANSDVALDYLVNKIKKDFGPAELIRLSRVVFVDPNDAAVRNLQRAFQVKHGAVEVRDSNFSGLQIKDALFITLKAQDEVGVS